VRMHKNEAPGPRPQASGLGKAQDLTLLKPDA
jgi:hypothetical protein